MFEITAQVSLIKDSVVNDVPYVSQFATPEFAERILKDKVPKESDPAWQTVGAVSPEEYSKWVTTQCGMACTAMVLEHYGKEAPGITTLAKDAFAHGVYQELGDELSGMRYQEFCEWVTKHDLEARFFTRLSLRGIQYALSQGGLVIASVSPNIRGYNTAPASQIGGHLVLITGYDLSNSTITINNPSGFISTNTHKAHTLSVTDFLHHYAHRGIILSLQ